MLTAIGRPKPPTELFERFDAPFAPALELEAWVRAVFIEADGPLTNVEHEHLQQASIGMLWTTKGQVRHARTVLGQAELPTFQGNGWSRGRQQQQMYEWFGQMPHFIITIDATYALNCSDVEFCALMEHELYHCGQEFDAFGSPKFKKDGTPSFAMRAHDVEEFIGVVRRYGPNNGVAALVAAASQPPSIDRARIDGVCGSCGLIL